MPTPYRPMNEPFESIASSLDSLDNAILLYVEAHPGQDDEEIAARFDIAPFDAAVILRRLEASGKLIGR
jgi:hypothetical protein